MEQATRARDGAAGIAFRVFLQTWPAIAIHGLRSQLAGARARAAAPDLMDPTSADKCVGGSGGITGEGYHTDACVAIVRGVHLVEWRVLS